MKKLLLLCIVLFSLCIGLPTYAQETDFISSFGYEDDINSSVNYNTAVDLFSDESGNYDPELFEINQAEIERSDFKIKRRLESLKAPRNQILDYEIVDDNLVRYLYYGAKTKIKKSFHNGAFHNEDVRLRTNNSRTFRVDDNKYKTHIYSGSPRFIKDKNNNWYDIEFATTTLENFQLATKPSFLGNLFLRSVYADNIIYSDSGDGRVRNRNYPWDAMHNAVNGTQAYATESATFASNGLDEFGWYVSNQAFLVFDTSILDDVLEIATATLNVYIEDTENGDNDGDDFITVVESNQNSTSTLVVGDWNNLLTNIHLLIERIDTSERKDITNINTDQYLSFILNSDGLDSIDKTGYTKLALLEGHTFVDSAYAGALTTNNYIYFSTSESTGTDQDPYLEIIYTATTSPEFMNLETGNINQSVQYKEVYDESGVLTGYEYTIDHNPFITFSIVIFCGLIFFFFLYQIIKGGFKLPGRKYQKYGDS